MPSGITRSAAALLACGLTAAAFTGCHKDDIHVYRVAKGSTDASTGSTETAAAAPMPQRLLAAMVDPGDRTWFFKLSGPAEQVTKFAPQFHAFVGSLRFNPGSADQPVTWTLPEGWTQENGGGPMRFATIHVDPAHHLDLTVTFLGGQAGGTLMNVNRWRGQIGLQSISEDQLPHLVKQIQQNGQTVSFVDMLGPGSTKKGVMMAPFAPFAGGATPPSAGPAPSAETVTPDQPPADGPHFAAPEGWRSKPADGFRFAAFEAGPSDAPAQVTVIPLGGDVGGVMANVNRWRTQVGLTPVSEAEVAKDVRTIDVDGGKAQSVSLVGPGAGGRGPEAIRVVMVEHAGATWFFKMTGPPATVEHETPAFEAFVQSVHFARSPAR